MKGMTSRRRTIQLMELSQMIEMTYYLKLTYRCTSSAKSMDLNI